MMEMESSVLLKKKRRPGCKILTSADLHKERQRRQFALDVGLGLSRRPKALPCKYIYDSRGFELYQKITGLQEYYLTNCELEILERCKDDFCNTFGPFRFNLVELGAGDGEKTGILLDAFCRQGLDFRYIPIDISERAMRELIDSMDHGCRNLEIEGLIAEYFDGLHYLSRQLQDVRIKNLLLFLGSTIGNFKSAEAESFVCNLWNLLNDGDYVLIGFDLKKDAGTMIRAYNDSQGVTSDFNRNLLYRINRELGGEFDPAAFDYFSTYNAASGAVESFLISRKSQNIYIRDLGHSFAFEPWEAIHTESSHKYSESEIGILAETFGFEIVYQGFDSEHFFVDSLWKVVKNGRRL
ncbi:MAG: L-histidine N(alpha)-methyltransferase [Syntrophales bacterium]|jgi:dimethylhistidine N-methyltransferase|nr:L-histidine N(alpha)-methyltransferase [Syntrophales bacterium]MDY0043652.1 L-histidine N(alpha)-methyltransferase [Syntrophales bacterium]